MMYQISLYAIPTIIFLVAVRKYRERKWGKCQNTVKLNGKVALVTGANSGIGYEIAKELAARGAHVILACRNLEKAIAAAAEIRKSLQNNPVLEPLELDLSSLRSVQSFAKIVNEYEFIHILVNNAGVAYPRNQRLQSIDGFEMHFAVNHLGHFYLTTLLEKVLVRSRARIIVVASSLHEKGRLDLKAIRNLEFEEGENLYANSKLANVYFAQELARRFKKSMNVHAVCPGWVYTNLFRHSFKWYHCILMVPVAFLYMRTAKQGSETAIYCATEPSLDEETGLMYKDCKKYNSKTIFYDKIATQLWDESQDMVNSCINQD
ncbi:retinol dehydrogenase 11 [Dendroctonus ponderosae]